MCLFISGLCWSSVGSVRADAQDEPETPTVEIDADEQSLWSLITGGLGALVDWVGDLAKSVFCLFVEWLALPLAGWVLYGFSAIYGTIMNPVLQAANVPVDWLYAANVFAPVNEFFAAVTATMTVAIAITVVRWILKVIPTIG